MKKKKIVVIGAGAAGLVAAGRAAELGAEVILLEHSDKPGRKLAITGKGRCNLTNDTDLTDFLSHFFPHGRFLRQAFATCFTTETIQFFQSIGISTVTERGGRVFPREAKAPQIVDALVRWNRENGVQLQQGFSASSLRIEKDRLVGVDVCKTETVKNKIRKRPATSRFFDADRIILATGGASYPATGSTGDGYRLAKSAGHSITAVRPALVPLETKGDLSAKMTNLSLKNISVKLWVDGKKKREIFGELKFTAFGLTGPVILTISHEVVDALDDNRRVALTIDLKPALDDRKIEARLLREFDQSGKKSFRNILKELMPRAMINCCVESLNIPPEKPGNQINARERKKLKAWLKELRFDITGYRPFSEAIITAGGVSLKEVNPNTMESRLVKGLYFAGEVLDIQADTGGYNLQAAFSTGFLAARSALND